MKVRQAAFVRIAAAAVAALVLSLLALAAPARATTTPETEPNNSTGQANTVAPGSTVTGAASGSGSDSDYFAVQLPGAGQLTLNLTFPTGGGTGAAYNVYVYDSTGSTLYAFGLFGGDGDGSRLAAEGIFLPAGKYYVRVYGDSGWASWGKPYALTPVFTAGATETEANDATSSADPIALGTTYKGSALGDGGSDSDYYAFDLPADGQVSLKLAFPLGLGTGTVYDVYLYDNAGGTRYSFGIQGGSYDGSWLAGQGIFLPKGHYYVRVYGDSDWPSWGKTYQLTTSFLGGTTETEPNDSTSTADVVTLGTKYSGSSLNAGGEDADYFAIDRPTSTAVSLGLFFPGGLGTGSGYDVDVYNQGGTQLYEFSVTLDRASGQWLAGQSVTLPAGRSYVRIEGDSDYPEWGRVYQFGIGAPGQWTVAHQRHFKSAPRPSIAGHARTGGRLTARTGTWSPRPTSFAFQWFRGRAPIPGATRARYRVKRSDRGKRLSVRVTASKAGYLTTTVASGKVTVRRH